MDTIPAYLKKIGLALLAATVFCCALPSCDNVIFDSEGDCSVTYRVAFRYDRNMKWADAFANEVGSVHLYAFDKDGTLVWQNTEKGEALTAYGYTMRLDLPAGDYHLVAWCGLDNSGERTESFTVPEAHVGETRLEELQCRLQREYDLAGAYSKEKLYPLYHGMLDVSLPDMSLEGGEYICTVPLTKDTNHVRVILQHLSGEPVNPKDFTFRIEEENGLMGHNNKLLPDEVITYRAYNTKSGTAGMGIDDYPELGTARQATALPAHTVTSVSVAIADLAIARLTEDRKTCLTIEKTGGETVARIPLRDYALLLKDGYRHEMTDEDYLDRQDEWTLTFFLNEHDKWINVSIIINSWRVVLNDVNFGEK